MNNETEIKRQQTILSLHEKLYVILSERIKASKEDSEQSIRDMIEVIDLESMISQRKMIIAELENKLSHEEVLRSGKPSKEMLSKTKQQAMSVLQKVKGKIHQEEEKMIMGLMGYLEDTNDAVRTNAYYSITQKLAEIRHRFAITV